MLIGVIGIAPICYAKTPTDITSIDQAKHETQDLIQTLKAYTTDRRDEAIKTTKLALDDLDKRIDVLETDIDNNWDMMNKDARKKPASV